MEVRENAFIVQEETDVATTCNERFFTYLMT
jgi:hypothetical protein